MTGLGRPIAEARAAIARLDEESPRTAGRARQAIGGLLVADGLVGLEHPFDGRRSRPGLLGSVVGVVIAAIFVVLPQVGLATIREERDAGSVDPFFTTGPGAGSFDSFDAGPPAIFDWFLWGFTIIGAVLLLTALATLLVRLASIGFGLLLVRRGTRQVAAAPPDAPGDARAEEVVAAARDRLVRTLTAGPGGVLGDAVRRRGRDSGSGTASGWDVHHGHHGHHGHHSQHHGGIGH